MTSPCDISCVSKLYDCRCQFFLNRYYQFEANIDMVPVWNLDLSAFATIPSCITPSKTLNFHFCDHKDVKIFGDCDWVIQSKEKINKLQISTKIIESGKL